jgi:hypothetical protein
MKKLAIFGVMPLLALVLLTGCMAGKKGPTDEEQVMQQTTAFAADILAVKADTILNYVSEDFTNDRVASKQELAEQIQKAKDKGKLDDMAETIKEHDGKIDLAQAKVTMDKKNGTATVYPIDATADVGAVSVELSFKKDSDKVWRIVGINIEGI